MKRPATAPRLSDEAVRLLGRAAALARSPAYLVGGAPRDALLGRATHDLDVAVRDARAFARALAADLGGSFVVLDAESGVFRVALGSRYKVIRQVDVAELQGRDIEDDLARRDFTINALAAPLSPAAPFLGPLLDPRGGLGDLRAGLIRAESPRLFEDDPLRLLRAFRIGAQLGFEVEDGTGALIRRLARRISASAGERVQAELLALLAQPGSASWLRRMDAAGLLTQVFPDLEPARECAAVYYGPGGVLEHSLRTVERVDFLLGGLGEVFPRHAQAISAELDARAQGEVGLRPVLKLAALLHDVSKAETARIVGGRLRFFGHDAAGADRCEAIMRRLKFSRAHIEVVRAVVAHHLRPGNLAASGLVTDKAAYRFFRDLGANALPLLLVCWSDHASYVALDFLERRLKTAATGPEEGAREVARLKPPEARKTVFHLQVVFELLRRLFDRPEVASPPRLIDGHELMRLLGLQPGPRVGELLEELREAQAEGRVRDREGAVSFLKGRAAKRGGAAKKGK